MTGAGLVSLSGLPGVGKSTLARVLAARSGAVWVRVDTIEQALLHSALGLADVADAGYRAGLGVAGDHLRLGRWVIADCVNPWMETRDLWRDLANACQARLVEAEIVCADPGQHRARVEGRQPDIAGHDLPDWAAVQGHDYRPWTRERLVIDTGRLDIEAGLALLLASMRG